MRLVAIFDDLPEMQSIRSERENQHFEYLRKHQDEILIAGGLRDDPGRPYVGGLWVLEVESKDRAIALIEDDPYYVPSCRSYRLLLWGKALADNRVVL
jgi:uncharacterized protein YciI